MIHCSLPLSLAEAEDNQMVVEEVVCLDAFGSAPSSLNLCHDDNVRGSKYCIIKLDTFQNVFKKKKSIIMSLTYEPQKTDFFLTTIRSVTLVQLQFVQLDPNYMFEVRF